MANFPHLRNDWYVLYLLLLVVLTRVGLPKLVTYSHQMMSSLDAAELMPDAHEETMNRHFEHRRWYTPLPSLHVCYVTSSLYLIMMINLCSLSA